MPGFPLREPWCDPDPPPPLFVPFPFPPPSSWLRMDASNASSLSVKVLICDASLCPAARSWFTSALRFASATAPPAKRFDIVRCAPDAMGTQSETPTS